MARIINLVRIINFNRTINTGIQENFMNVKKAAVECLMPKLKQNIRKYVKKYFNLKEKYLILLHKDNYNNKGLIKLKHLINLIKLKNLKANLKQKIKYRNGNCRALNSELD